MNIYEQALSNLTEDNWAKERLFDNDGNRCLAGHLCTPCNTGLGQFRDNPAFLLAAVAYLIEREEGAA